MEDGTDFSMMSSAETKALKADLGKNDRLMTCQNRMRRWSLYHVGFYVFSFLYQVTNFNIVPNLKNGFR